MGKNIHAISAGYLLCSPARWSVDRGSICIERLFGGATTKTDKTLVLVLQILKTTTPFDVYTFDFFMIWFVSLCSRTWYTLAFHLLYTLIDCDCLVYAVSQSVTT